MGQTSNVQQMLDNKFVTGDDTLKQLHGTLAEAVAAMAPAPASASSTLEMQASAGRNPSLEAVAQPSPSTLAQQVVRTRRKSYAKDLYAKSSPALLPASMDAQLQAALPARHGRCSAPPLQPHGSLLSLLVLQALALALRVAFLGALQWLGTVWVLWVVLQWVGLRCQRMFNSIRALPSHRLPATNGTDKKIHVLLRSHHETYSGTKRWNHSLLFCAVLFGPLWTKSPSRSRTWLELQSSGESGQSLQREDGRGWKRHSIKHADDNLSDMFANPDKSNMHIRLKIALKKLKTFLEASYSEAKFEWSQADGKSTSHYTTVAQVVSTHRAVTRLQWKQSMVNKLGI